MQDKEEKEFIEMVAQKAFVLISEYCDENIDLMRKVNKQLFAYGVAYLKMVAPNKLDELIQQLDNYVKGSK